MANKWVRKLGIGISMVMTASQLGVIPAYAAPEKDGFSDETEEELFAEADFGDLLEEKFEEEAVEEEDAEDSPEEEDEEELTEETESAENTGAGKGDVPVWKDGSVYIKEKEVKNYTGLAVAESEKDKPWVYIENGKRDESYTGFAEYDGELFYVEDGTMQTDKNGVQIDPNSSERNLKFYFCAGGQVQKKHEGLAEYDGEWFYIKSGLVQIDMNAFVEYDGGLFAVAAGRIVGEYSGLMQDPENTTDGDWYFFAKGQAQTQYTGLAEYDGAWFYVINGKLATSFTGMVEYDGDTFYVNNGMLSQEGPATSAGNGVGTYRMSTAVPDKCINPVTDKEFSVTPNDGIDDTAEINHALTVAAVDTDHHTVYLPAGVYDISIQGGEGKSALLFQYEGVHLVMDENAVLRLASNSYSGYNAILIHANNVSISGGQLIGERAGHGSDELGYGHGVAVDRAHATIENMKISSNRGDGIYLADSGKKTECFDVTIKNCEIFDNSRSNISVVRADNVTLANCDLHGAQGTAPMAAMNIEPNRSSSGSFYCCNHISVQDTVFSSYGKAAPYKGTGGLWCDYALLVLSHTGQTVATDLRFDNCIFNGAFDNGDTQGTVATGCIFNGDIFERSPLSVN